MRCLFPLFQAQFNLLKPKLVYILSGSVNLFCDLSHDPGRPLILLRFQMLPYRPQF